ncbi:hypothetical protein UF75_2301 [Desulfosporosinus sp. I2]|nr:hypothetical protein UF75_2301 [Desulfosporosinus sp. I2]
MFGAERVGKDLIAQEFVQYVFRASGISLPRTDLIIKAIDWNWNHEL